MEKVNEVIEIINKTDIINNINLEKQVKNIDKNKQLFYNNKKLITGDDINERYR